MENRQWVQDMNQSILMVSKDQEYNNNILAREDLLRLGYSLLRSRCYTHHTAQDIALDALYMCAKKYLTNKGTSVKTYYNKCLFWSSGHYWKKVYREKEVNEIAFFQRETAVSPVAPIKAEVDNVLKLLSPKQRNMVHMVKIEKYTMSEVALLYGITRQRVGQIIAESEEIIRKKIKSAYWGEL